MDFDKFENQVQFLMEWFNTDLSAVIIARLYKSLESRLTDQEFELACQRIFESKSRNYPGYFPCVQDFCGQVEEEMNWRLTGNGDRLSLPASRLLQSEILSELKRLNKPGVLPDEWQQRTGLELVGQLNQAQSQEFLNYLRTLEVPA